MTWIIGVLIVLGVIGCATPTIAPNIVCFDRGQLGLTVGDIAGPLRLACAEGRIAPDQCRELERIGQAARKAILTPAPPGDPSESEAILKFIGTGMAIMGKMYGLP